MSTWQPGPPDPEPEPGRPRTPSPGVEPPGTDELPVDDVPTAERPTGRGRASRRTTGGRGGVAGGAARAGRALGRAAGTTGKGAATAARATTRATGRASRYTVVQARRASHAEGAGETGLSRLLEMHAFGAAGDAAVAISLAGTLFFQVPTGEARGQVTLFLLLTMLPFAIVAPLIGPFLDRFSHGRRWAIGSTMAVRAFLCWALAGAVATDSPWLFPAALGVLVASKAYGVTKAAAVPRLLPPSLTLVKANGRTSLAGVVGATVSAPIAVLASTFGAEWSLRYAFLVFTIATVLAILLPARVDSTQGEEPLALMPGPSALVDPGAEGVEVGAAPVGRDARARRAGGARGRRRVRRQVRLPGLGMPPTVAYALRANCGPRWTSGFLTMFMAFLLRENPIAGWSTELLLGIVIGAAGLGNTLGIALASVLRRVDPLRTVAAAIAADAALAALTAAFYGVLTLGLLGLAAGLAQSLAKLSLDSTIQRDVPERVRTSAFARSDTLLQLAWVTGGFVGILMPLMPRLGLGVAATLLLAWLAFVLGTRPASLRGREASYAAAG